MSGRCCSASLYIIMGTDIHGVFQRHDSTTGNWEDIPSKFNENRHYQLFAVLAGVRNGTGFAGVKTGEPVKPIAKPRGLPEGFEVDEGDAHPIASIDLIAEWQRKYRREGDPLNVWMGDHSHSWLTADEMLAWFERAPVVVHTGILDRDVYEKWDHKTAPAGYCGGIFGPGVVLINDNQLERDSTPNWTHIHCEWDAPLKQELAYFFNEVARLQAEYGQVRFVFGFDS